MSGALQGLTTGFKLNLVNFDFPNWADYINNNFEVIDALFRTYITSQGITGVWQLATDYEVNDRTLDEDTGNIYVCQVAHTSASSGSFEDDRTANPTYWRALIYDPRSRGSWTTGTAYALNDFVVSGNKYAICEADHTSGATFAGDVSGGKWTVLIDLSTDLAAAAASAASAASSASAASASASAAAGSASTASTAASTATTQAGNASTSASAASSSASSASGSASAASTSAGNANTSAIAAAASASSAAASLAAMTAINASYTGALGLFIQTSGVTGWVKADGNTIGNASSGATRANADTQALFVAIWNDTTNTECQLYTSAGATVARGANAAADYAANRRIAVPDVRAMFLRGLDASRGIDSGRVNASRQNQQIANHVHRFTANIDTSAFSGGGLNGAKAISTNSDPDDIDTQNPLSSSLPADTTAGNENRPVNMAFTPYWKL